MAAAEDRPGLRRNDWAAGRVEYPHSSWAAVAFLWVMTFGWMTLVVIIGRLILLEYLNKFDTLSGGRRIGLPLLMVVLLAVGLYLLRLARNESRLKGFGRSIFEMTRVPGVIGGRLDGVVRACARPMSHAGANVTLTCGFRVFSGHARTTATGRTEDALSHELWHATQEINAGQLVRSGTEISIPVSFPIPGDLPPTDLADPAQGGTVVWRVAVKIPTIHYDAWFYIPVFKAAEAEVAPALAPPAELPASSTPVGQPATSKIKVLATERGVAIRLQSPIRLIGQIVGWSLVLVVLAWPVSWLPALAGTPFPVILGVAGALAALWFLINVLALTAIPTRLEIGGGALTIRTGAGAIGKVRAIPIGDIESVKSARMRGESAHRLIEQKVHVYARVNFYDVNVHTSDGATYCAAFRVRRDEAEWLTTEIRRHVGR